MAENVTTKHKPADDGGVFCRYENDDTGQSEIRISSDGLGTGGFYSCSAEL